MVIYNCEICEKAFKQKGHYNSHMKRKNICKKDNTLKKKHIRFVDFFAGIGGFRYGINAFQELHPEYTFECIKTVDIKKGALDTYNLNFNENNHPTDICTVGNIPKFELLCAGFPCQPFSSAGKKEGFSDEKRGNLIYEVIRICQESTPEYLILENVSNIEKLEKGNILKKIINEFENIGYMMQYKTINSKDVGLAQDRERTFIIGFRSTERKIIIMPPTKYQTVNDIIDANDTITNIPTEFLNMLLKRDPSLLYGMSIKDKRGGKNNIHSWDIEYYGETSQSQRNLLNQILKERRKKKWAEIKGIVWMDGMPLTTDEIKTFIDYKELEYDLNYLTNQGYLKVEYPKDLVDGKREYKDTCEQGYNICKGKLSFPISKILDPSKTSPTLTATDASKLAIYTGTTIRRLNKKELIRLCGFPESITLPESVDMYDLFGNMVCPPIITEILKSIFL